VAIFRERHNAHVRFRLRRLRGAIGEEGAPNADVCPAAARGSRPLVSWKVKSPFTIARTTCSSLFSRPGPAAKRAARAREGEGSRRARCPRRQASWHSLRHSAGSEWLTEFGIPVTTESAMMRHANPSFTDLQHGRFREGGRDGDRPPRVAKSVDSRARSFPRHLHCSASVKIRVT
jgi:hypothetical protein